MILLMGYNKVNILTLMLRRSQTKFELHMNKTVNYFKPYLLVKCTFIFSSEINDP